MSLPENYVPRKGDVLLLRATVKFDVEPGEEDAHLKIVGSEHTTVVVPLKDIEGLLYRSWKSGDKVQESKQPVCATDEKPRAVVVAVWDDQVWVKYEKTGRMHTYHANALEPQPTVEEV